MASGEELSLLTSTRKWSGDPKERGVSLGAVALYILCDGTPDSTRLAVLTPIAV